MADYDAGVLITIGVTVTTLAAFFLGLRERLNRIERSNIEEHRALLSLVEKSMEDSTRRNREMHERFSVEAKEHREAHQRLIDKIGDLTVEIFRSGTQRVKKD